MTMNLSELSVKRPTLVVVVFTVLAFLGILSYRSLKYELIPEFSSPVFTVVTAYPGAGSVEVENSVSKPIEEALAGLPNIDVIRAISQEGVSIVMVTLQINADVDPIVNEAVRKIQAARSQLPPQALEPTVTKICDKRRDPVAREPVCRVEHGVHYPAGRFADHYRRCRLGAFRPDTGRNTGNVCHALFPA